MPQLVKPFLRRLRNDYYHLRRRSYELLGNPKYSKPARANLDTRLQLYLGYSGGFFIEVGANDGYTQSNTYYLERFCGWNGVLVEGIPELYNRCKRERRRSRVYNYALVSADYPDETIEIHYSNLMSAVEFAFESRDDLGAHIESGLKVQGIENTYTVRIPAITLESVLDMLKPDKIDFFSLDVEGYEAEVLMGLNLDKYQPHYILVEMNKYDLVYQLLKDHYTLVEVIGDIDCLFCLKELNTVPGV